MDDQTVEEAPVLDVEGLVQPVVLGDELQAGRPGLVTAALRTGRVVRAHEEDHERDKRDDDEEQDRPEDSPDQISEHCFWPPLFGSYLVVKA